MLGLGLPALAAWQALKGWLPSRLFAAGEQGGLWDFTTLANLYQDSAGTSPVTTVGQTIGLVLDTKNGTPQLGADVMPAGSGDFSNPSMWNLASGVTISGGMLNIGPSVVNAAQLSVPSTAIIGKWYKVTAELVSYTSGGAFKIISPSGATAVDIGTTPGIYTGYWLCDLNAVQFMVRNVSGTVNATIDNISVRELPGNHLTQSTSTKRPLLGRMPATGVRNLLTYTDSLSTGWGSARVTVSDAGFAFAGVAGNATKILEAADNNSHGRYLPFTGVSGTTYTLSFRVKSAERTKCFLSFDGGEPGAAFFDLSTGSVIGGGLAGNASITSLGDGVFLCSVNRVSSGSAWNVQVGPLNDAGSFSYVGDVTKGIYASAGQLEIGSTATAYQKVGAAYDITESGVASVYTAYFDGVDDCLVSPSIDFTGTDKMTVFAGARKVDDTARIVAELSSIATTNAGSFYVLSGTDVSFTGWQSPSTGSTGIGVAYIAYSTISGPDTAVLSMSHDIPGDLSTIRRNGVAGTSGTGDKGAGNFGNYPLYVGQRGAASLPYKGFMTALSARGATTDADTIVKMEKWLAARTPGVTLP